MGFKDGVKDVDECANDVDDRDEKAKCLNKLGSFEFIAKVVTG